MSKNKSQFIKNRFKNTISVAILFFMQVNVMISSAKAKDYFNPALLDLGSPNQSIADLSVFEEKGGQISGTYFVEIYINNKKIDTRNVLFKRIKDSNNNEKLYPCISVKDLEKWGVIVKNYPELKVPNDQCANLQGIPQADSNFIFSQQLLLLNFPQSSINNTVRGWIEPESWNEGIPAFLLSYSLSGDKNYSNSSQDQKNYSQYINLRSGFNIGSWRFRNYSTWTNSDNDTSNKKSKWDSIYTYAQKNIISLKSQLTLGDTSSPSDVFDSVPFTGVQLASDDNMLPDSLQGYAPIIRGVAKTNAQVTIKQNDYIIYQTYVPSGGFEIKDIYPTGGSGDLYMTIREADGSEQNLVIPFASLPVLQREGKLKYSVTIGRYRPYDIDINKPTLTQATALYGLPWGVTILGGGQFSSNYSSAALGLAKNLGSLGAVSLDTTKSWSKIFNENKTSGESWRLRYSKDFIETGTTLAIAGYRYTSKDFRTLGDVLDTYNNDYSYNQNQRHNREELTLNQSLWPGWGSLAVTAIHENYWNTEHKMASYGVSYNNSYKGISYGLNYSYNQNSSRIDTADNNSKTEYNDQLLSFNLSFPMSNLFRKHPTYASYMINTSENGNTHQSINIGGTLLERDNLNWNIQEGYGSKGDGHSFSANAAWRSTYGELAGGYFRNADSNNVNYRLQGGVLAHQNGITFGQPLGETIALISAPGAKRVGIVNQTGVRTDYRGYTLVPYISPYRRNDITLDSETLSENTELILTTQTVTPTRGAVVKADYRVSIGHKVLMNLLRGDGTPIPFGATVIVNNSENTETFIVGDAGQVYLTGVQTQGQLLVKWGDNSDERCVVDFTIPDNMKGIINMNGQCYEGK